MTLESDQYNVFAFTLKSTVNPVLLVEKLQIYTDYIVFDLTQLGIESTT